MATYLKSFLRTIVSQSIDENFKQNSLILCLYRAEVTIWGGGSTIPNSDSSDNKNNLTLFVKRQS